MEEDLNKDIISSKPQRNRRRINYEYSSEETNSSNIESMEGSDLENEQEHEKILTEQEQIDILNKYATKQYNYKYLNHTADVILQGIGNSLEECFESVCIGMFNYMCNLDLVENKIERKIVVLGEDLNGLLFNFMNEFHFLYGSDYYICKHIDITNFDKINYRITALGYGDIFNRSIHEAGTEIKAITKHGLKVKETDDNKYEVFVLVDI